MSEPMSRDELVARILALDYVGERVVCEVCGLLKTPLSRMPMDYPVCLPQCCSGYYEEPSPQQLHPGERASEFFGWGDDFMLGFDRISELWGLIRELRENGEDAAPVDHGDNR